MAEVPKQIAELIAKFDQNLDAYHTTAYGETEVRVEFINPFFEALGWDVANRSGYAEAYLELLTDNAIGERRMIDLSREPVKLYKVLWLMRRLRRATHDEKDS